MCSNWPNYKLMQQMHAVCCKYQNSCNWHERLKGHWRNSGFINNLASEVSVTRLWGSIEQDDGNSMWMLMKEGVWAMGQIARAYGAFKVPPHNTFFLNINGNWILIHINKTNEWNNAGWEKVKKGYCTWVILRKTAYFSNEILKERNRYFLFSFHGNLLYICSRSHF